MHSNQEYSKLIEECLKGAKSIQGYELESLIRSKELGTQGSFKRAEPIIKNLRFIAGMITKESLLKLPFNQIEALYNQLRPVVNILNQIVDYDPNRGNSLDNRNSLMERLEVQFGIFYNAAMPIILLKPIIEPTPSSIIAKLRDENARELAEIKGRLEQATTEAEMAAGAIQTASREAGIDKHATIFSQESIHHEGESVKWLGWTVAILIFTLIVSYILLIQSTGLGDDPKGGKIVQFVLTRVTILSILFFGVAFCTKNFRAHRHNATLNKHRQNALSTFQTFVNAPGIDSATKNAVLLEATHSIFSNQQTGYLSTEKDSDSSNKIIEIFKNFSDGAR